MCLAPSPDKNAAIAPTSSDVMLDFKGVLSSMEESVFLKSRMPAAESVFTGPAEIALTRIFEGPRS
jgi:hypothetical protein